MSAGRSRLAAALPAAAVLVPLALFLVRFEAFVRGGVFSFRDAGFFFVPWRTVTARLVREGLFPFWNDAMSSGRALAADPNAAVFWPLTGLAAPFGTTWLGLANAAAALALFFLAARKLRLSPGLAGAGTTALLFSGVFQTLALLFTSMAAFAPAALGLVAAERIAREDGRARRWVAVLAACMALSTFGGEPAITAIAALGALGVALFSRPRGRALLLTLSGCALGAALAAVQIAPAAGELSRSARGGNRMSAAGGALFFSVRPSRALTLLEPRLTGDPFAENEDDFWGADAFDARNPYFYDIAFGLLPLLLALAATAERRAVPFVAVSAAAGVLACARFLPGYAAFAKYLAVFRYPEKWWALATAGLLLAALLAADALARGEARVARRLGVLSAACAVLLGTGALLAAAAPGALRAVLWSLGLGAGPAPAARVAALLGPRLAVDALTALVTCVFAFALVRGRVTFARAALAGAVLFLFDAAARTAATCPAGDPSLFSDPSAGVRLVTRLQGDGRFADDQADVREVAMRRFREANGFDQLRPTTGVLFGIRYAGDNDIDRMTSVESFEWARSTALLPWGEEKVRRYRCAGVTVARTPARGPDPPAAHAVSAEGGDRIVAIAPTRAPFTFLPRVRRVAPGASLDGGRGADPTETLTVEDAARAGETTCAAGRLRVLHADANRQLLDVEAGPGAACLAVARTFDPNWRARLDGAPLPAARADGCFTAYFVPAGRHRLELRYANPLYAIGAAVSLAALGATLLLLRR